jgi:hypothetical protein
MIKWYINDRFICLIYFSLINLFYKTTLEKLLFILQFMQSEDIAGLSKVYKKYIIMQVLETVQVL